MGGSGIDPLRPPEPAGRHKAVPYAKPADILLECPPVISLTAQTELVDQGLVAAFLLGLQIVQEAATL